MRVEVIQEYNDKERGTLMRIGDKFDVDVKRGNLLISMGYAKLIPEVEDKPEYFSPKKQRNAYNQDE